MKGKKGRGKCKNWDVEGKMGRKEGEVRVRGKRVNGGSWREGLGRMERERR